MRAPMPSVFHTARCRTVPRPPSTPTNCPMRHGAHNAGVAGSSPAPAIGKHGPSEPNHLTSAPMGVPMGFPAPSAAVAR
jgi:hypothetical protein